MTLVLAPLVLLLFVWATRELLREFSDIRLATLATHEAGAASPQARSTQGSANTDSSRQGSGRSSTSTAPPPKEEPPPQPDAPPPPRARTHYDVLQVPRDATLEQIKAAYKELVQQYHPDKVSHLAPEFRARAEQVMKELNEARDVLTNARKRAAYDAKLRQEGL